MNHSDIHCGDCGSAFAEHIFGCGFVILLILSFYPISFFRVWMAQRPILQLRAHCRTLSSTSGG